MQIEASSSNPETSQPGIAENRTLQLAQINGPAPLRLNTLNFPSRTIQIPLEAADYRDILRSGRVVFFWDDHRNQAICAHLARFMPQLKEIGFTHYLVEAPISELQKFNRLNRPNSNRFINLSSVDCGPNPGAPKVIRAAHDAGLLVLPFDVGKKSERLPYRAQQEAREAFITGQFLNHLGKDDNARLLIQCGGFHAKKDTWGVSKIQTARARLRAEGIASIVVGFSGGANGMRFKECYQPHIAFRAALKGAGLSHEEFMIRTEYLSDLADDEIYFGRGNLDYIVNLAD